MKCSSKVFIAKGAEEHLMSEKVANEHYPLIYTLILCLLKGLNQSMDGYGADAIVILQREFQCQLSFLI